MLTLQPHPTLAGPTVMHLTFLKHLDPTRFEVHVALPPDHPMRDRYEEAASSVVTVPGLGMMHRWGRATDAVRYGISAARLSHRIARLARRLRVNVVHTSNEVCPPGGIGARLARVPSVVHVIGMRIFEPELAGAIMCRFHRATADRIVCAQGAIRSGFSRHGVPDRKLALVYNCVDPGEIVRSAEATPALEIEPGTLRIGSVGAISIRKGSEPLVRAAFRVCREFPQARVFLVGDPEWAPDIVARLRRAVADEGLEGRIVLTGRVENIGSWLRSFDIYTIPSLSEALSVAGLEAMALGKPIVATNVGGNPEAVEDGVTGLLCRAGDPDDLADRLIELGRDEQRRRAMGEAGARRVQELFTADASASRLGDVFEQVVAANR